MFQTTRGFSRVSTGAARGVHDERQMENVIPVYVCRQTAAHMLDMSDDTFDKYVREGILPQPKRRGGLKRWKWSEIVAALDGGCIEVIEVEPDAFEKGIQHAKAARGRAA
jgi:predicted DNA-binding transcriptional regulator AlpA